MKFTVTQSTTKAGTWVAENVPEVGEIYYKMEGATPPGAMMALWKYIEKLGKTNA